VCAFACVRVCVRACGCVCGCVYASMCVWVCAPQAWRRQDAAIARTILIYIYIYILYNIALFLETRLNPKPSGHSSISINQKKPLKPVSFRVLKKWGVSFLFSTSIPCGLEKKCDITYIHTYIYTHAYTSICLNYTGLVVDGLRSGSVAATGSSERSNHIYIYIVIND